MNIFMKSAVAAFGMAIATTAAAANIDTSGQTNSSTGPFGVPTTPTYGQTFTAAPGDSVLNAFSLFLTANATPLTFRGYLAEWNGTTATNLLFTSGVQTLAANSGTQEFNFAPGVALTAGAQYVALLSVNGFAQASTNANATMPTFNGNVSNTDLLPGGNFVFNNNAQNFVGTTWGNFGARNDAAFKATFGTTSAVPEPATWGMMILGFGLVGGALRSRRTRTAVRFA